jgi:hypothetical protein
MLQPGHIEELAPIDVELPKRIATRKDRELPNERNSQILTRDAEHCVDRTDVLLPIYKYFETDVAPLFTKHLNTDNELPDRNADLMDSAEAKLMKVKVLKLAPIFEVEARTDNVDPIEKKFTIENVFTDPNLHIPKHDAPDPNRNAQRIESNEPKFTKVRVEHLIPICALPRIEILLPNFTRSNTLKEPLTFVEHLKLIALPSNK